MPTTELARPRIEKRRSIRVGDRVCIDNPEFVDRVGYPLTWTMLVSEFEINPKFLQAMELLGIEDNSGARQEFLVGACKAAVRSRKFGGKERTIHTQRQDFMKGMIEEVHRKRTVRTGTYFPPSYSGGGAYSEPEYEPGGLDNAKSHVLLLTSCGEIEASNVSLVAEKP